jgi:O-antigen/teichoic acid export membrane protein
MGAGSLLLSLRLVDRLPRVHWADVKAVLHQGKPLFASQLVALAYTGSGPILISWLAGLEQAGTYGVIERLAASVSGAALLVHTAAYPTLAQLYHSDRQAYLKLAGLVTVTYLLAGLVVTALGWALREPVLAYLYGGTGARPYALYLLALAWIASGIFGTVVTGYYVVSGQPRQVYRLTCLVLGASLAFGIPGVVLYGAAGWMGGVVAAQVLVIITALRQWKKEHEPERG